jgi:hypothetical protein
MQRITGITIDWCATRLRYVSVVLTDNQTTELDWRVRYAMRFYMNGKPYTKWYYRGQTYHNCFPLSLESADLVHLYERLDAILGE